MVETALFHQLRARGRAVVRGLLLVLLATWLAAVCPHCLAQADANAPTQRTGESMRCHGAAVPAPVDPASPIQPDTFVHDGCPQAPSCTGNDCAQLTAVDRGEPLAMLIAEPSAPVFVAADFLSVAYPSTPPPAVAIVAVLAVAGCPLYLRHCAFLN